MPQANAPSQLKQLVKGPMLISHTKMYNYFTSQESFNTVDSVLRE